MEQILGGKKMIGRVIFITHTVQMEPPAFFINSSRFKCFITHTVQMELLLLQIL